MTKKKLIIQILTPVGITLFTLLLLFISWSSPGFAAWYARNIYPIFVHTIGRFFNIFPFSVFELGLVLIPIGLFIAFVFTIYFFIMYIKKHNLAALQKLIKTLKITGFTVLCFFSFLFTFFVLNAGINYNRESFADHVGVAVQNSSVDELISLYNILVERAAELSLVVSTDEDGVFIASSTGHRTEARAAMKNLHNKYGGLTSFLPPPRSPVLSRIMSYMRITGFFSIWTLEAHYNGEMPVILKPFTMTHELAHVAGHMREDEANFIAYLASRNSECIDFMYSAVFVGIRYVLSALHRVVSSETYAELFFMLPDQVRRDMAANRAFWQQFEGPVAEAANRANDAYLRANRQEDGVQSYGRMIDLLLAYYRMNNML